MALIVKIKKAIELSIQIINRKKYRIAIIGGYHKGNLGDMALGFAVQSIASKLNINSVLQTIYNLDKLPYPKIEYAIIGGGACGYTDSMKKVAARYKNDYSKVAILGVDFNEKEYKDEDVLNLLKYASWISCRNNIQKQILTQITNRKDILVHPDIAFSLYKDACKEYRYKKKDKTMLINLVPLYSKIENGEVFPVDNYREERPELYENYKQMIDSYIKGVRIVVEDALKKGYTVESLPFTPDDASFTRMALKGLPVKYNSYSSIPKDIIKKMSKADTILATRYHATIFAMKLGANIIPLAYARKNEYLLNELGVDRNAYLTTEDLSRGLYSFPDSIKIEEGIVSRWEQESEDLVTACITKLLTES